MSVGMSSVSLEDGVSLFLRNFLSLGNQNAGCVVCLYNEHSHVVAYLIDSLRQRGVTCLIIVIDNFDDSTFHTVLNQNLCRLKKKDIRDTFILMCEGRKLNFSRVLKQIAQKQNHYVWRLIDVSSELFQLCFGVSNQKLKNINASLLTYLMSAKSIRVRSDAGTDLTVRFSKKYKWVSNHGLPAGGKINIMPAGEVNTYPDDISGIFVANGALHSNLNLSEDVRLSDHPVKFEISNGQMKDFHCDSVEITKFLSEIFSKFDNSRRVGEFGIGTNVSIQKFVMRNSIINERFPGVHLGFGEHAQFNLVKYTSKVHLDAISSYGEIYFPEENKHIDLCHLDAMRYFNHPRGTNPEDIEHIPDELLE